MKPENPAPARSSVFERHPRLMTGLLLLGALVLGIVFFLGADNLYTRLLAASAHASGANNCMAPDPVRHHAYKPSCTGVNRWGAAVYPVFTNDLGMRDANVRRVPRDAGKPRLLLLGDSFTDGAGPWSDTYAGMIAAHFPALDVLNGGVVSYAPSNYLNVARSVIEKGYRVDEVLVFIDISDVQDEAAYYRDRDGLGAVTGPARQQIVTGWYSRLREQVRRHYVVTDALLRAIESLSVRLGVYRLDSYTYGNVFDMERSAWTYRKVQDDLPYPAGYAPLGMAGGIARERDKMTTLWRELEAHHIALGVVVYPWPAQVLHDGATPLEERIWRDWCAGKCRRFISLYPAFRELKAECPAREPGCWYERYFIAGDTHYNARGNAVVAEVVEKSLAADPPIRHAP